MAKLERQNDTLSYYFGWYGICDGETSCADFVLNESRDVYDHIYRVFQINQFGDNYSIFDGTYDFENSNEQQFQDFSSLTCGKAYLIVLREGDGFLNLDNFTYTNDSTASFGGLLRTSCVDANPPITTEIKQSSDSLSFYMGWYGVCDECTETYDLTIEGHREKIFRVFQINERNENYSVFLPSYTPEQDFMQDFTHLECGRAYLIVLKRGNETLDDLTNFVATNKLSTSAGTLVDDCQAPVGNNLNSPRVALTSENIDVDNMIWFDSSDIPTVNATMYNVTKECGEVEPVPTPTATPSYTPTPSPTLTSFDTTRQTSCGNPCTSLVSSKSNFSNLGDTWASYQALSQGSVYNDVQSEQINDWSIVLTEISNVSAPAFMQNESHVLQIETRSSSGYNAGFFILDQDAQSETITPNSCATISFKFSFVSSTSGGNDGMAYGLVAKQGDNYFANNYGITKETSTVIDTIDKELVDGSWLRIAGSGETSQPEWNAPTSFGVFFANSNSNITKTIATDFKICLYHPEITPTPTLTPSYEEPVPTETRTSTPTSTPTPTPTPTSIINPKGNPIQSGFSIFGDPAIPSLSKNGNTIAIAYPHSQVLRVFDINESKEWVQRGTDITIISNNSSGVGSPDATTRLLSINADGTRVGVTMSSSVAKFFPVQVFEWSNNSWSQLGSNLPISTSYYPTSIQLDDDGSNLIVGTSRYGSNQRATQAKVFTYDGSDWNQKGSPFPQGVVASINGDGSVVATIEWATYTSNSYARLYEWNVSNSSWDQKGSTINSGKTTNPFTQIGLSSNGNVATINNTSGYGLRVYYWDNDDSDWNQKGSAFGTNCSNSSIDHDGQTLIVGRWIATGLSGQYTWKGRVEVFVWNQTNDTWESVGVIEESETYDQMWLTSLSKNGNTFAVGGRQESIVNVYQIGQLISTPTPTPITDKLDLGGYLLDGYIKNASGQLIDLETDEVITEFTTDDYGKWSIKILDNELPKLYKIKFLPGGIDILTNKEVKTTFSNIATKQETIELSSKTINISPVTTLKSAMVENKIKKIIEETPEDSEINLQELDIIITETKNFVANKFDIPVEDLEVDYINEENTELLKANAKLSVITESLKDIVTEIEETIKEDKIFESIVTEFEKTKVAEETSSRDIKIKELINTNAINIVKNVVSEESTTDIKEDSNIISNIKSISDVVMDTIETESQPSDGEVNFIDEVQNVAKNILSTIEYVKEIVQQKDLSNDKIEDTSDAIKIKLSVKKQQIEDIKIEDIFHPTPTPTETSTPTFTSDDGGSESDEPTPTETSTPTPTPSETSTPTFTSDDEGS